jgi:WhiB family redox-sensing transcriptional regulator
MTAAPSPKTVAVAQRVLRLLADGGEVTHVIRKTGWSRQAVLAAAKAARYRYDAETDLCTPPGNPHTALAVPGYQAVLADIKAGRTVAAVAKTRGWTREAVLLLGALNEFRHNPATDAFTASAGDGSDPEDLDWQEQALCTQTDPEAFFAEKGGSAKDAKKTCRACPVRAECLEYALAHGERFGIWGGESERDRRRMKRLRAA